jgi:hypothetical protein
MICGKIKKKMPHRQISVREIFANAAIKDESILYV